MKGLKTVYIVLVFFFFCDVLCLLVDAAEFEHYQVGVDDMLDISVVQPEEISKSVVVYPDGTITFPYIGIVHVKGKTLEQIRNVMEDKFSNGYMKYPVIYVSLQESRSRKFFVYGEVTDPGTYPLYENITVLRAISMAGGFTKYGSSSRIKLLRPQKDGIGYDTEKIDIKSVMEGDSTEDQLLKNGDILVISEGIF